jgi:hypothetical protein
MSEKTYEVEISKPDQKEILKLYEGSKKVPPLPLTKIVERFQNKYTNTKRQVMRVLHNNKKREYSHSSLI